MSPRSSRISLRVRQLERRVLERAAAHEGATLSGFVRSVALTTARARLARPLKVMPKSDTRVLDPRDE